MLGIRSSIMKVLVRKYGAFIFVFLLSHQPHVLSLGTDNVRSLTDKPASVHVRTPRGAAHTQPGRTVSSTEDDGQEGLGGREWKGRLYGPSVTAHCCYYKRAVINHLAKTH